MYEIDEYKDKEKQVKVYKEDMKDKFMRQMSTKIRRNK